jgi:ABC-type nitrate/sulfonate/bicarbonate transport system permease component
METLHTLLGYLPQIGWVSGAFLVGLLVGVCIGFTIGSTPTIPDWHGDKR